ncbi:hypothetical protein BLOT_008353 [Blomia tropicalis]|nr:hypothetical protein BLOT_008353 [Blomia tropicalis]
MANHWTGPTLPYRAFIIFIQMRFKNGKQTERKQFIYIGPSGTMFMTLGHFVCLCVPNSMLQTQTKQ